jgi:hypothetical protein
MNINYPTPPHYEVSLIKVNNFISFPIVYDAIKYLEKLDNNIVLLENDINNKINEFINNNVCIEINILFNIDGIKKSIYKIEYLSEEIVQISLSFSEEDINENILIKLKYLLNDLLIHYNGIVGMIGWETVCSKVFFKTNEAYPHNEYSIKNIKIIKNNNKN